MITVPRTLLKLKALRYVVPQPRVSSREWLESHVTMPEGTETSGQPFSVDSFPHVDGVLQAFDDDSVRTIVLQWGTRLGKTTTCLSLAAKTAGTNPRNMMLAGATKDAIGRVVSSRLYPILESTDEVKKQLPPEHRRSKFDVRLAACRVYVGWSGSETSLADVGAWYGCANEIDKWDQDVSDEADSLSLFLNRCKGFVDHKIILESTPTIRGRSRIETWMNRSNQHRRYVPCPHCGKYQILRKGDLATPGGFRWDSNAHGQSDPDRAFATAYYECEHCDGKIENHHRVRMLRAGIWVPNGCSVNDDGEISGTALRAGSDIVGFGPLPSWYSLTETWGSFARAWIRAQAKPRDLQDVVNSYMAETWEKRQSKTTPERIADRISGRTEPGIIPRGGIFVTVTVDRQRRDGGYVVWVVMAHGKDGRSWEIDHGKSESLPHVWDEVMSRQFAHEDNGPPLQPVICGVDSGWNTKDTYAFCNLHRGVIALKGSSTDLGGRPYKLAELDDSTRTEAEGQLLLHVNTEYWEEDLQNRLDNKLANEDGALTLSRTTRMDDDFMNQVANATLSDKVDSKGNAKLLWIKKHESQDNDYRDCIRYGLCLAEVYIASEGIPERNHDNYQPIPVETAKESGFVRQKNEGWIRRRSS